MRELSIVEILQVRDQTGAARDDRLFVDNRGQLVRQRDGKDQQVQVFCVERDRWVQEG